MEKQKLLFFLHIPKTAGTTMNTIMRSNFGKSSIIHLNKPYQHAESLREQWSVKGSRARLVSGHFPYGIHEHIDVEPAYFAVIRNPYERVYSFYKYILNTPTHYYHKELTEKRWTFEEFLRDGTVPEVSNQQVRLLTGCKVDSKAVNEETYAEAIANIHKHFSLVGVQDRFEQTLALMKIKLGLRSIRHYSKNVRKESAPIKFDEGELQLLNQTNFFDMKLYSYVCDYFASQVEENRKLIQDELQLLNAQNKSLRFRTYSYVLEKIDDPRRNITKKISKLLSQK